MAALTLALGIGANTAIFSVVDAVLLRPFPYKNSGRLVMIWDQLTKLGLTQFPVTFANYRDYRNQNGVFEDIAAFDYANFNLTEAANPPERIAGMRVSANLFPVLGAEAALGRTFAWEERQPGRSSVAILSDELWRRRFGADPKVVGRTITLDQDLFVVVGIMPRTFRFTTRSVNPPELWTPLIVPADSGRTAGALQLLARLKPGVSIESAQANMKTLAAGIEQQYHPFRGPHGEDAGYGVSVISLRDQVFGNMRQGLIMLMGAVGFVLLIACANLANLLLAKAASRQKEMAIRKALGAGRGRLMAQLLTESTLLALLGGCLGLLLAVWGVAGLAAIAPRTMSIPATIKLSAPALAFTLTLSLLTGLLFGLAPAARATKASLNESMRGAERHWLPVSAPDFLVAAEVALLLVLVAGAGLLMKSFVRLQQVNPGFNAERVVTAQISLEQSQYRQSYQSAAFFSQLLERLAALPEVRSASVTSRLPLSGAGGGARGGDPFSIEGRAYNPNSRTPQVVNYQVTGLNYFRTMQIPVLSGRDFSAQDTDTSIPVAIINETMARGFWPGKSPLGQRIMLGAPRPGKPWLTIVGVAGDVRNASLDVTPIPQMYAPHAQNPSRAMTIVVLTDADPLAVLSGMRGEVFALDRSQPLYDVNTMQHRLAGSVAQPRFQSTLLGLFAAFALMLGAVGIYGVVSYSVAQRTREIGIRMALGAQSGDVLKTIVSRRAPMVLAGIAIGVGVALALARLMSSLLYGVSAKDPWVLLGSASVLALVALVAAFIPARRALSIDPVRALRHE